MSGTDELITIYRAANVTEAHLVKNLLGDEGIDAFAAEENDALSGLNLSETEVMVRRADVDRAKAIVDEYEQQQIDRAERPDWSCACGATVVGAFDECDVCGAARPGSDEAGGE